MGGGQILEDVFQTESCGDPMEEIEYVAEPFVDSVCKEINCPESPIYPVDEIEDVAEPLDDSVDEEIDCPEPPFEK